MEVKQLPNPSLKDGKDANNHDPTISRPPEGDCPIECLIECLLTKVGPCDIPGLVANYLSATVAGLSHRDR